MNATSRRALIAAVAAACLTSTTLAVSGVKASIPVTISGNSTSGTASGTLGSARASSDNAQYIGCTNYGTYGWCFAEDANSNTGACYWSTSAQAAAVGAVTPMSYITFSWDSSGNCTALHVSTFSYYLPPTP